MFVLNLHLTLTIIPYTEIMCCSQHDILIVTITGAQTHTASYQFCAFILHDDLADFGLKP